MESRYNRFKEKIHDMARKFFELEHEYQNLVDLLETVEPLDLDEKNLNRKRRK